MWKITLWAPSVIIPLVALTKDSIPSTSTTYPCSRSIVLRHLPVCGACMLLVLPWMPRWMVLPTCCTTFLLAFPSEPALAQGPLFDLPRFHLLVFPPSRFGLVFGEIDCCLHFDHFDIVNCRLQVIFDRLLCPFTGSLGSESYFFWRHSLFAI